jgi:hypothetical protein
VLAADPTGAALGAGGNVRSALLEHPIPTNATPRTHRSRHRLMNVILRVPDRIGKLWVAAAAFSSRSSPIEPAVAAR